MYLVLAEWMVWGERRSSPVLLDITLTQEKLRWDFGIIGYNEY
jgi:hypothetical protein